MIHLEKAPYRDFWVYHTWYGSPHLELTATFQPPKTEDFDTRYGSPHSEPTQTFQPPKLRISIKPHSDPTHTFESPKFHIPSTHHWFCAFVIWVFIGATFLSFSFGDSVKQFSSQRDWGFRLASFDSVCLPERVLTVWHVVALIWMRHIHLGSCFRQVRTRFFTVHIASLCGDHIYRIQYFEIISVGLWFV